MPTPRYQASSTAKKSQSPQGVSESQASEATEAGGVQTPAVQMAYWRRTSMLPFMRVPEKSEEKRVCATSPATSHPYLCPTMLTIRSQQQTRTAHATAENLALDPNSYWAIQMWLPKSCPPMPTMDASNACTSQTIRPLSLSSPSRIPRPARC